MLFNVNVVPTLNIDLRNLILNDVMSVLNLFNVLEKNYLYYLMKMKIFDNNDDDMIEVDNMDSY
jgi:hypothetical protein